MGSLADSLLEARLDEVSYEVGTERERSDGTYKKVKMPNVWIRMPLVRRHPVKKGRPWREPDADSDPAYAADEMARLNKTIVNLGKVVRNGRTVILKSQGKVVKKNVHRLANGMSLEDHVNEGKRLLETHKQGYEDFLEGLDDIAPEASTIRGRTKTLESTLGKLVRKPDEYDRPSKLFDLTGAQVVVEDMDGVRAVVKKLEKQYKLSRETKYNNYASGYRGVHLIVDHNGVDKEIQVRTRHQDDFANWSHQVTKPLSRRQQNLVLKHSAKITDYAIRTAAHFDELDAGLKPTTKRPPCPPEINASLGCID